MTILFNKWRIKDYSPGGYIVQRKVGKQYKQTSYFNTLEQAVKYLFQEQVRDETADLVIDTINKSEALITSNKLVRRIDRVSDEILGVLHG